MYSVSCPHRYCYIHNISTDASFARNDKNYQFSSPKFRQITDNRNKQLFMITLKKKNWILLEYISTFNHKRFFFLICFIKHIFSIFVNQNRGNDHAIANRATIRAQIEWTLLLCTGSSLCTESDPTGPVLGTRPSESTDPFLRFPLHWCHWREVEDLGDLQQMVGAEMFEGCEKTGPRFSRAADSALYTHEPFKHVMRITIFRIWKQVDFSKPALVRQHTYILYIDKNFRHYILSDVHTFFLPVQFTLHFYCPLLTCTSCLRNPH